MTKTDKEAIKYLEEFDDYLFRNDYKYNIIELIRKQKSEIRSQQRMIKTLKLVNSINEEKINDLKNRINDYSKED